MHDSAMLATVPGSLLSSKQVEQATELLGGLPPLDPTSLADAFRELPLVGLVPAVVALLTGLLLWWHGERFLRFALMVLGIVVGVPVGLALGAAFAPTLPPLAAAIVGAVALVILAAIGLKFAVAGGLAFLLGIASVLGTILAIERGLVKLDDPPADAPQAQRSDRFPSQGIMLARWQADSDSSDATAGGGDAESTGPLDHLRASMTKAQEWTQERWDRLPPQGRTLAAAAGLVGAVIGFGIGLVFRRGAMRLVTALLGSMLILAGATAILGRSMPDWTAASLPGGPWLAMWGALAVTGGILQAKRSRKKASDEE
ncbi:MAG: hypothetical protein ACO3EP_06325 [Phycisphaerales bacterium]